MDAPLGESGDKSATRTKPRLLLMAIVPMSAIVAAVILLTPVEGEAQGGTAEVLEWSESLSLLTQQPQGLDAKIDPSLLDGMTPGSLRVVHSSDELESAVWISEKGELCLSTLIAGDTGITGSTCTTTEFFAKHGLPLVMDTVDGSYTIYLLPDGVAPSLETGPYEQVSANLLIGDPYEVADFAGGYERDGDAASRTFEMLSFGPPAGFEDPGVK